MSKQEIYPRHDVTFATPLLARHMYRDARIGVAVDEAGGVWVLGVEAPGTPYKWEYYGTLEHGLVFGGDRDVIAALQLFEEE